MTLYFYGFLKQQKRIVTSGWQKEKLPQVVVVFLKATERSTAGTPKPKRQSDLPTLWQFACLKSILSFKCFLKRKFHATGVKGGGNHTQTHDPSRLFPAPPRVSLATAPFFPAHCGLQVERNRCFLWHAFLRQQGPNH